MRVYGGFKPTGTDETLGQIGQTSWDKHCNISGIYIAAECCQNNFLQDYLP